jgi:hypothetical protein
VPRWVDWIRNSPSRGFTAEIVSLEGTEYLSQISDALASRGVNTVALQVTQQEEFTLASGVSVTPTLLGMDRRGYVRFVSGVFSHEVRRALDQFIELEGKALPIH